MVNCRGVFDSTGEEIQDVDKAVFESDRGLSEVVLAEFDDVIDEYRFGGNVGDFKASVVLEVRADVEYRTAAEVPGFEGAELVVYDDTATNAEC